MKEKFILYSAAIISLFVVSPSYAFDFDSLMRESTGKEETAEKAVQPSQNAGGVNFDSLMRGAAGEERGSSTSSDQRVEISLDGVEAGRHRMRVGKAAKKLAPKNMEMKKACSCVLSGQNCTEIPAFDDMDATERLMLKEEKNEEVKLAACIEWSKNISSNPPGDLAEINSSIVFIDRLLASFREMDSDVAQQVASLEREQRNELRRQRRQRQEREEREERARREAEEEEEERRIANQPAQTSAWASALMDGLNKAGDDLLRQQRENNERILTATKQAYKEKKRRQDEEREARELRERQEKERQRGADNRRLAQLKREKQERLERKREKAREKRDLRDKCEQKGGKFHDRTGNCTIIKTLNTVVLTDLGTNRVYGDEASSVNGRLGSSSRATSQANGASNNTSNSGASGKQKAAQEQSRIDVAEVRMLCWVKDKEKGGQNWKCSGPVQTAVLNSPTEEEAMKYQGCDNPRKKFTNVRFTKKSGESINYDRAYVYACDRPFDSHEKRIEDRYNIQYPASVIFQKYQCDTDVFLGHWRKYCK